MNKPKVAMLAMYKGGIGHYIAELSSRLTGSVELEFISYKYGLPGDEVKMDDPAIAGNLPKVPAFLISYNKYAETTASLNDVINFLKQNAIDILNVHVGTIVRETAYFIISLVTVAKKLGIKILYTFHDVEPFEEYAGGKELLETLYLLADRGTVGGDIELQKLVDNYNFPKDKLLIAKHGVYSIFDFNKYDRESARVHLGLPLDKKIILNFGIFRPYKGFDNTIEAMPKILEAEQDAYLNISTGIRVFKNTDKLDSLVSTLKLENNVSLKYDFVPSEEIEPIFKACDIVVLPYKQVSQSGILNLALYFKKPVVVSNLFVEAPQIDGKLGLVVEPDKTDQISEAVIKLLSDSEFYNECQDNIGEFTKNDIWAESAKIYMESFERLMAEKDEV